MFQEWDNPEEIAKNFRGADPYPLPHRFSSASLRGVLATSSLRPSRVRGTSLSLSNCASASAEKRVHGMASRRAASMLLPVTNAVGAILNPTQRLVDFVKGLLFRGYPYSETKLFGV